MDIEIKVIAARNIIAGDITGTSDAYIKLYLNDKQFDKTKVTKPTLNPDWNEIFKCKAKKGDKLKFHLYDHDRFSRDDELGEVNYIIPDLITGETIYEIQKFSTQGLLYFSIICRKGGIEKQEKDVDIKDKVILKISSVNLKLYNFLIPREARNADKYTVRVGVKSDHTPQAETDRAAELWTANYPQEFYVETRVEEKISFSMIFSEKKDDKSEELAKGDWRVPDLRDGEVITAAVASKNYATFNVKIECLRGIYHNVKKDQIPSPSDEGRNDLVRYQILMEKGMNIPRKDKHSESDPYVKLKTLRNKNWRFTPAMYDNASPKWMEGLKLKCKPGSELIMHVYDYDKSSKRDDIIGKAELTIPTDLKLETPKQFSCKIGTYNSSFIVLSLKRMRNLTVSYYKLKYGEDYLEKVQEEEKIKKEKEKEKKKQKK